MSRSTVSIVKNATNQRFEREVWSHVSRRVIQTAAVDATTVLPVLAAGFAVPQFVPQILKLRRTGDVAGLSAPWAVLTGVNNTAWAGYFAASHYWFALIPSTSAAVLGGCLGAMLSRRRTMTGRTWAVVGAWTVALVVAAGIDRRVLGATLAVAFLVQVVPAVAAAYRADRPTGIARGTWRLVLGETSCWAAFGGLTGDGPLSVLGVTGVVSAVLMLRRARLARRATGRRPATGLGAGASPGAAVRSAPAASVRRRAAAPPGAP
jgi:hypothetical protein